MNLFTIKILYNFLLNYYYLVVIYKLLCVFARSDCIIPIYIVLVYIIIVFLKHNMFTKNLILCEIYLYSDICIGNKTVDLERLSKNIQIIC